MPRAIWKGAISFGLVRVPVSLVVAVREDRVDFRLIERKTGQRIHYLTVNDKGDEVDRDDIVKGYELDSGKHVAIEPDDLADLAPERSETIEIQAFAALSDIDPIYYDRPYYLMPDEGATKPYALLMRAMEESDRVGIAKFVMHEREHLTALRPLNGVLCLVMMRFAEDVEPTEDLGLDLDGVKTSGDELDIAKQLIEAMAREFAPGDYSDEYRDSVRELVKARAAGKKAPAPKREKKQAPPEGLTDALKQSLEAAKSKR